MELKWENQMWSSDNFLSPDYYMITITVGIIGKIQVMPVLRISDDKKIIGQTYRSPNGKVMIICLRPEDFENANQFKMGFISSKRFMISLSCVSIYKISKEEFDLNRLKYRRLPKDNLFKI